jgi:menaquinone-dependent protoporphyrinogen IX oxidase
VKDILVVFYSRSGTTRRAAEELAVLCRCDSEQIQDVHGRRGVFGALRSGWDAITKRLPAIRPAVHDALHYDLVVIGAPVWASTAASPARTYLMQHRREFNRVAFFCTMGGSGGDKALREMARLTDKTPVATLSLVEAEIKANRHIEKLREFADALVGAVSREPARPPRTAAKARNEHA